MICLLSLIFFPILFCSPSVDTMLKHPGGLTLVETDPPPEGVPPVEVEMVSGEEAGDRPPHKTRLARSDSETSAASEHQPVIYLTDCEWYSVSRMLCSSSQMKCSLKAWHDHKCMHHYFIYDLSLLYWGVSSTEISSVRKIRLIDTSR